MSEQPFILPKLIHVGEILTAHGKQYLFLRKKGHSFVWFQGSGIDEPTPIKALTSTEAMKMAYQTWGGQSFRMLNCGFLYTLPERDEHGMNALFSQMVQSYGSSNGVYFDQELGHNCVVHLASDEARRLWQTLKQQSRL